MLHGALPLKERKVAESIALPLNWNMGNACLWSVKHPGTVDRALVMTPQMVPADPQQPKDIRGGFEFIVTKVPYETAELFPVSRPSGLGFHLQ
jgi:hypothetical protein